MTTIKIYDKDAYISEFDAMVQSAVEADNGCTAVVLDATAFFPEAGGQCCDLGFIENAAVTDVQIDEDGMITHYLDGVGFSAGMKVHAQIDWKRRHTLMQHHTGEHIFSGITFRDFGYSNVGFHLSDHICTMDYNGPLSIEDISKIEKECNEWVYRNVPVISGYPGERELEGMAYRCKGELSGPVRIVEIRGVDTCACCAPHLKSTGEIGLLKVIEAKNYKGGVRLEISCGRKAFSDYRRRFGILQEVSQMMSAKEENIKDNINSLKNDKYRLNNEVISLQEAKIRLLASPVDRRDGLTIIFVEEADEKAVRSVINGLTADRPEGVCGVFCGDDEMGYRFVMGSASRDMRQTAALMREELNAKCGGSQKMIQGSVVSKRTDIMQYLKNSCKLNVMDIQ